eukprot:sb/3464826/
MSHDQVVGGRVRGVTVVKAIVVGNTSVYLGGKRDTDGHTHTWTVYLKPFKSENMSTYVFFHVKFEVLSMRVGNAHLTKPPYRVSESGWGEFEIMIKVFVHDPSEKPVTFLHLLKLFQNETVTMKDKTLISENYDEIIFTEPTSLMYPLLINTKPLDPSLSQHHLNFEEIERKTFTAIVEARRKIKTEIAELSTRIKNQKESYQIIKQEVKELEQEQNTKTVNYDDRPFTPVYIRGGEYNERFTKIMNDWVREIKDYPTEYGFNALFSTSLPDEVLTQFMSPTVEVLLPYFNGPEFHDLLESTPFSLIVLEDSAFVGACAKLASRLDIPVLFQNETVTMKDKTLISENYDEIIFTEPTSLMYPLLINTKPLDPSLSQHHLNFEEIERKTFTAIVEARRKIKTEIAELSTRIKNQKESYQIIKQEVKELEQEQNTKT